MTNELGPPEGILVRAARYRVVSLVFWALPPLVVLWAGGVFGVSGWLTVPLASAHLVFRPIRLGLITRTVASVAILLWVSHMPPLMSFALNAFSHGVFGWVSRRPLLLRIPLYPLAYIGIMACVWLVLATAWLLLVRPVVTMILKESLARQAGRDLQVGRLLRRLESGRRIPRPRYALYLRPFTTKNRLGTRNIKNTSRRRALVIDSSRSQNDLESVLAAAFPSWAPLVALGSRADLLTTRPEVQEAVLVIPGTGKLVCTEENWRSRVQLFADNADLVVVVPLDFPGTLWEVEYLRDSGQFWKCVFVMPASVAQGTNYHEAWRRASDAYAAHGMPLPRYRAEGALFTYDVDGHTREVRPLLWPWIPRPMGMFLRFALMRWASLANRRRLSQ
ncbi:hypothetical protein [Streptomyces sp. NPDC020362]|uniref:hypothetical protein n=1 Tax=unclassified Streptomyces TaxID=2593676 RepID=UPI0033E6664D